MRKVLFLIGIILLAILILGCSGSKKKDTSVIAVVNGEEITVEDLYSNPNFKRVVDQAINETIIRQEFQARKLVLDEEKYKAEYTLFVDSMGNGDEAAALEALRNQGVDKKVVEDSIKYKIMMEQIILQDFPITMEDARAEFEGNLEANQRMYAMQIPEKETDPTSITFEDVADKVLDNMIKRQYSQKLQETVDALFNKYVDNNWIVNNIKPVEKKDLTKIEPAIKREQIDPDKLKKARMQSGDSKEEKPAKPSEGESSGNSEEHGH